MLAAREGATADSRQSRGQHNTLQVHVVEGTQGYHVGFKRVAPVIGFGDRYTFYLDRLEVHPRELVQVSRQEVEIVGIHGSRHFQCIDIQVGNGARQSSGCDIHIQCRGRDGHQHEKCDYESSYHSFIFINNFNLQI